MKTAAEHKADGNKAFAEKNFDAAIESYTKAIELDPNDHVFFSNRSACYASVNKYDEALADAEKCVQMKPDFCKGYSRKGVALFHMGRAEDALETVQAGLKIDPNNDQLKKDLAVYEDAISSSSASMNDMMGMLNNPEIQKMLKENPQLVQQLLQNPQMAQMMMNMMAGKGGKKPAPGKQGAEPGHSHSHDGEPCGGHDQHEAPKAREPSYPSQKKHEEKKPEEKKPEEAKASSPADQLKNAGNQLYKEKKFEEAIAKYDESIALDDKNMLVRNNKAACLIELKKIAEAREVTDKALERYAELDFSEKNPMHLAKLLARRGRIASLENQYDDSIKFYEKSLLEDRNEQVEKDLKDVKKLKKTFDEQAYIDPVKSEEHREKGNQFFNKGEFGAALKEYEEALRRNPNDARIYNNRANAFVKIMNYQQALYEVEKALKIDPKFIKALLRKASIHDFLKEYHKAVEVYNSVLKIEPDNAEAAKGLQATNMHIASSMHGETDEQRVRRAMADPEIAAIVADPMIRIALEQMQNNPKNIPEYMKDTNLGPKIAKLIQAGIIRTG